VNSDTTAVDPNLICSQCYRLMCECICGRTAPPPKFYKTESVP